jgi:hypothetical protein
VTEIIGAEKSDTNNPPDQPPPAARGAPQGYKMLERQNEVTNAVLNPHGESEPPDVREDRRSASSWPPPSA